MCVCVCVSARFCICSCACASERVQAERLKGSGSRGITACDVLLARVLVHVRWVCAWVCVLVCVCVCARAWEHVHVARGLCACVLACCACRACVRMCAVRARALCVCVLCVPTIAMAAGTWFAGKVHGVGLLLIAFGLPATARCFEVLLQVITYNTAISAGEKGKAKAACTFPISTNNEK